MKFNFVLNLVSIFTMMSLGTSTALAFDAQPLINIGTGVLFEKNNDAVTDSTRLPLSFGAGAQIARWQARLEYSSYRTSDGNATASISRAHEAVLAWSAYEFGSIDGWTPYAALGLGMGRTTAESQVSGSYDTVRGIWSGVFAAAVGLRAAWAEHFSVRPEIRYESADSFKTKDARMGVFVQLDYLF